MPEDNNTSGNTAGYTGMGASCGVCGAWVQAGQTHLCSQYVPPSNPFPSTPIYVQPATFPQWIDPNVLERIATALEKLSTEKTLKDIVGTLDGEAEIAATFRLHMKRFWSYEEIRDFCLGFLSEDDKRENEKMIFDELNISIYLFKDSGVWVAQCLEYDIAVQGKTIQDTLDSLEELILGQIHLDTKNGIVPLSEIEPIPKSVLAELIIHKAKGDKNE